MAGQLEMTGMSLLNRRPQFVAGDVHVGLVRSHTFVGPVVHQMPGIVGTGEFVHLGKHGWLAFEIRSGEIDLGTGHHAGVDALLHLDIGIGLKTAGGAHGGDTRAEIQTRRGEGDFRHDQSGLVDPAIRPALYADRIRVVEMIVHPDEAGNDGVAGAIQLLGIGGCRDRPDRTHRLNLAVGDYDCSDSLSPARRCHRSRAHGSTPPLAP